MSFIDKIMVRLDAVQQKHPVLAFPYALVKKYGDDEAGYQGALITYYGFLSLFPLLIVATSVIDMATRHNDTLRERLITGINNYFPSIGESIQKSIHSSTQTGIVLLIGLLITLYGAKGVADAVQHAINHVWEVPKQKRAGFPNGLFKSVGLIVGGGIGFLGASVISGYATAAFGHSIVSRILLLSISVALLFGVFMFVFRIASSAKHSYHQLIPGAIIAAIGLQILQTFGGYLITHQLRHLQGVYGQFGLVLAIMFWLYLQAQVFLYAAEINTLKALKLWPRSLTGKPLTKADHEAFRLYAQRETYHSPDEEVAVKFTGKTS